MKPSEQAVKVFGSHPLKWVVATTASAVLVTAACTSGGDNTGATPTKTSTRATLPTSATTAQSSGRSARSKVNASDIALIVAMYNRISEAFRRNPDDGVRAIIATQYPGDRADVGFARCINAVSPGAKSLPRSASLRFVPNIASVMPDPGYTVTSDHVHDLRPSGRIYTTEVTITQGERSTVHERHQVVRDGRAYQFSTC